MYTYIRNSIINLCRKYPHLYISASECLNHIGGDCCDIIRVHSLLEHWGLINFTTDLMNQNTSSIFPIDTTAELATKDLLKHELLDNVLRDDWVSSFARWGKSQKLKRFDKFENILWVERMMEKVGGSDQARQVSVLREVMDGLISKKKFRCSQCEGYLGIRFARVEMDVKAALDVVFENVKPGAKIKSQNQENQASDQQNSPVKIEEELPENPQSSIKSREQARKTLIKEILKKERSAVKLCLACYQRPSKTEQVQTTDSETKLPEPSNYQELSITQLIQSYSEALAPRIASNNWAQQEPRPQPQPEPEPIPTNFSSYYNQVQRDIFKFKNTEGMTDFERKMAILKFLRSHGGRVSNAIENVEKHGRVRFIREYLAIAVQQMERTRELVPESFPFFLDINQWEHGRHNSFFSSLDTVKKTLETESDLNELDTLLKEFLESQEKLKNNTLSQKSTIKIDEKTQKIFKLAKAITKKPQVQPSKIEKIKTPKTNHEEPQKNKPISHPKLNKRDHQEFSESTPTPNPTPHSQLAKIMKTRAEILRAKQVSKTNKILKEILHVMMSKFSKKLFLVEEYEKMLLHEDLVLDLKFNEKLASEFVKIWDKE